MARARLREDVRCPECGVAMYERKRRTPRGEDEGDGVMFFGCLRFPLCVGTRPGEGEDRADSYTELLRRAYLRALQCLSQPRFFGNDARAWLLEKGLGRELEPGDLRDKILPVLSAATLESAVDAACAYVQEQGLSVDFLVDAHEERMANIRANMKGAIPFDVTHKPPALIVRRYDISQVEQLEARLGPSPAQIKDGIHCPRCGSWSEELEKTRSGGSPFLMFGREHGIYDCPLCGKFNTELGGNGNWDDETHFVYESDKDNKQVVPGTILGLARRDEKL